MSNCIAISPFIYYKYTHAHTHLQKAINMHIYPVLIPVVSLSSLVDTSLATSINVLALIDFRAERIHKFKWLTGHLKLATKSTKKPPKNEGINHATAAKHSFVYIANHLPSHLPCLPVCCTEEGLQNLWHIAYRRQVQAIRLTPTVPPPSRCCAT